MVAAPRCPICGSQEGARFALRKGGCDLYHCAPCDHFFVSPMPSQEELSQLYRAHTGEVARFIKYREADPEATAQKARFQSRLERICAHRQDGRLLDVGCAHGAFLLLARRRGFEIQGVELSPKVAEIARRAGVPVLVCRLEEAKFPDGSFDVVNLGDIIEHVPDPGALLGEVARVLVPGGVVAVATPNHDAFFARATWGLYRWLGIPWSHPSPPEHLHQFSERSLCRLLDQQGFTPRGIYYEPPELLYQMRATGCPGDLKRALEARNPGEAIRSGIATAAVGLTYPLVRLLDLARLGRKKDVTIDVVAERR